MAVFTGMGIDYFVYRRNRNPLVIAIAIPTLLLVCLLHVFFIKYSNTRSCSRKPRFLVTDGVEKTLGFGAGFGYRINTVQMWWLLVASSHRGC